MCKQLETCTDYYVQTQGLVIDVEYISYYIYVDNYILLQNLGDAII